MKFHSVPITQAVGHILGHNILSRSGRRIMRKGRVLTDTDIELLRSEDKSTVYIAEFESHDVPEDIAGTQIAQSVSGSSLRLSKAITGRVNIYAPSLGVLQVDEEALLTLNLLDGVALATQHNHAVVQPDEMVANLKIVPYALAQDVVDEAIAVGHAEVVVNIVPLMPQKACLILTGGSAVEEKTVRGFQRALEPRLARLNASLEAIHFVPAESDSFESDLSAKVQETSHAYDLLLLAGDTAIMDRQDIVPKSVEAAGGDVICFGAPVDPGNLFMLAYLNEIAVIGVPGCARNPKDNLIDLILPRVLAGETLVRRDIARLGSGGLLKG